MTDINVNEVSPFRRSRRHWVNFGVGAGALEKRRARSFCRIISGRRLSHPLVWLKRHPIPVVAHFQRSLVLAYALPGELLEPLLPPGLFLDRFKGFGFVAIALVQTRLLRPAFLPPWLGRDFFLAGYRIFARYTTRAGRTLRGLRILRSDTDRRLMVCLGNRLTHYNYRLATVNFIESDQRLDAEIKTPRGEADLHVVAHLSKCPAPLPANSPFADLREARLFAGPLPFTFDYEPETHSIVMIEGVRQNWKPRLVSVDVLKNTFLDQEPLNRATPVLASAFQVENIAYRWKRGVRETLPLMEPNDESK